MPGKGRRRAARAGAAAARGVSPASGHWRCGSRKEGSGCGPGGAPSAGLAAPGHRAAQGGSVAHPAIRASRGSNSAWAAGPARAEHGRRCASGQSGGEPWRVGGWAQAGIRQGRPRARGAAIVCHCCGLRAIGAASRAGCGGKWARSFRGAPQERPCARGTRDHPGWCLVASRGTASCAGPAHSRRGQCARGGLARGVRGAGKGARTPCGGGFASGVRCPCCGAAASRPAPGRRFRRQSRPAGQMQLARTRCGGVSVKLTTRVAMHENRPHRTARMESFPVTLSAPAGRRRHRPDEAGAVRVPSGAARPGLRV